MTTYNSAFHAKDFQVILCPPIYIIYRSLTNSFYPTINLPSHKPFKYDEQDIPSSFGEVRMNS